MAGKNHQLVTAKQISQRFKVAYPTINHYTNLGFFSIVKRDGNKRLFSGPDVKRSLDLIAKMMDEGYPLRLIRKKLSGEGSLS